MFQVTTQNTYVEVLSKLFLERTLVVSEIKKRKSKGGVDKVGHIEQIFH